MDLPINKYRREICDAVTQPGVTVIIGETGSGKSTQIPFILRESIANVHRQGRSSRFVAAVTVPRRLAAISLSNYVKSLSDDPDTIAHHVRFSNTVTKRTKVKYMTDGMLLQELMTSESLDVGFSKYDFIVVDEAHERGVNTDVLLSLLKQQMSKQHCPRIVIMSATVDSVAFDDFFGGVRVVSVPGRSFPIDTFYTSQPVDDYVTATVKAVLQVHLEDSDEVAEGTSVDGAKPSRANSDRGVILAFLPSVEDVETVSRMLTAKNAILERNGMPTLDPAILHASLSPEVQRETIAPRTTAGRRVIVSTNIAEASLTIPGVRVVIDCGLVKQVQSAGPLMSALAVCETSRASADQRKGRAGREAPGRVFRLYTEDVYHTLPKYSLPDILCSDLTSTVLRLSGVGLNLEEMKLVDSPPREGVVASVRFLQKLGLIDGARSLTTKGKFVSSNGLEPILGNLLYEARDHPETLHDVLSLVAILSGDDFPVALLRSSGTGQDKLFNCRDGSDIVNAVSRKSDHWRLAVLGDPLRNPHPKGHIASALHVRKCLAKSIGLEVPAPLADTPARIEAFTKALIRGLWFNVCKSESRSKPSNANRVGMDRNSLSESGSFRTLWNTSCFVHPHSLCQSSPDFQVSELVFNGLILSKRYFVRLATPICSEWVLEACPDAFSSK